MSDQRASQFSSRLAAMLAIAGSAWLAAATGLATAQTAEKAPAEASAVTATTATATLNPLLTCSLPSNCVNSRTSSGLAPLAFSGTGAEAMALLEATLASFKEATVQTKNQTTVEAVFSTPIGFRDNVVFIIDAQLRHIDFRSSSGFGLYDFGKNRSRMQAVTARFAQLSAAAQAK